MNDQWRSSGKYSKNIELNLGMCHSYVILPEGNRHSPILGTQQPANELPKHEVEKPDHCLILFVFLNVSVFCSQSGSITPLKD